MRMRTLGFLAAVAVLLVAARAGALDAPHDQTFSSGQCDNCHAFAVRTPTGKYDYNTGCLSCHYGLSNPSIGIRWQAPVHEAVPEKVGNQHNWSGYASNKSHGAQSPVIGLLSQRLVDGKLQCIVCHDLHGANPSYAPDSKHTSIDPGMAVTNGAGWLTLVASADAAKAWRIKVQADSTFIISHDFALANPTWLNWNGTGWVAGADPGPGKSYLPLGQPVTVDDGVTSIKITGAPAAGAYWDFYVSYPFLRISNVSDAFCQQCHGERLMNHVRVAGNDAYYAPDGKRLFSHPVSVALNANGKGYDRLQTAVLDADGSAQPPPGTAGGDSRAANDLKFDGTAPSGVVRCTTCHAAHNAASNSLTNQ